MEEAIAALKKVFNPLGPGYANGHTPTLSAISRTREIIVGPYRASRTLLLEELPEAIGFPGGRTSQPSTTNWHFKTEFPGAVNHPQGGTDYSKSHLRVTLKNGVHKVVVEEATHSAAPVLSIRFIGPKAHRAFRELKAHFEQFKD